MTTDATDEIKNLENAINRTKLFAIAFIIIIPAVYFIWFYFLNDQPLSKDSSMWGTFGDFIGGVLNPVVALLAFYWLTKSVLIQKTELAETQKILAETEKAQRNQSVTQEKKRFEDTFYSLLGQFNSVFDSLSSTPSHQNESPFRKLYKNTISFTPKYDQQGLVKAMHYQSQESSHYFRILYHLLKFILLNHDSSKSDRDFNTSIEENISTDEKFYSNIVRSFLNKQIIQFLAINCLVDEDHDFYKFKLLVERYSMLEHLILDFDLTNRNFIIDGYSPSAFGTNQTVKCYLERKL